MALGQKLREARKNAGYTQRQLAEMIGAKHNSISNWENGLNMPDPPTIESICDALGVTPNYLLMGSGLEASEASRDRFSVSEIEMLRKYRGLDMRAKGAVDALLDYYHESVPARIVELPSNMGYQSALRENNSMDTNGFEILEGAISIQSVAAGTGTYLGHDAFETIRVKKNNLTKRADFYVPVSGDSMEPKFHDGDILVIERAPARHGEIGIFTLEGQGFVKVRGKNELISLNPAYDPIQMSDDIICNGRVLGVLEPEYLVD